MIREWPLGRDIQTYGSTRFCSIPGAICINVMRHVHVCFGRKVPCLQNAVVFRVDMSGNPFPKVFPSCFYLLKCYNGVLWDTLKFTVHYHSEGFTHYWKSTDWFFYKRRNPNYKWTPSASCMWERKGLAVVLALVQGLQLSLQPKDSFEFSIFLSCTGE